MAVSSQTGRVLHIEEVEDGFDGAICPDCQSPLIASNRNRSTRLKDTYFRHKGDSNCQGETLIHLWAKQVIEDSKQVFGAEFEAVGRAEDSEKKIHTVERLIPPEHLMLENIEVEKRIADAGDVKIPDVMGVVVDSGAPLAIEIFVNNAVSEEKASFFESTKLDCLEINLSSLPPHLLKKPEEFEEYVIRTAERAWIFCSRYRALENQAQREAEEKAERESEAVRIRKEREVSIKGRWRRDHGSFLRLVEAYLDPNNQNLVKSIYESHRDRPGTLSHSYKIWFESNFGETPEIINIPLKGELAFDCHRSVWQWEIYQRAVLYTCYKSPQRKGSNIPSFHWSPEELFSSIRDVIPLNRIAQEAHRIEEGAIVTEREKPESLIGLKVKEWRELPKPVCTIRRYVKELEKRAILKHSFEDTYTVPQNVKLPIVHDVSSLNIDYE